MVTVGQERGTFPLYHNNDRPLLRPRDIAQSLTAECFERLRSRADDASVFLYGFDLLSIDGTDIHRDRLDDRYAKLRNLLARPDGDLTGRKRTKKKSSAGAEPSLGRNHWTEVAPEFWDENLNG